MTGGNIGKRLMRVEHLMHGGDSCPRVTLATPMRDVIHEVSRGRLGMTCVVDAAGGLVGVITDGDIRRLMARVDSVHVAYKGSAQYVVDMLASRMDLCICGTATLPHIRAGRLRVLGVSAAKRDPAIPDVPTIAESGLPGFEVVGWFGLLTTAGTPTPIV